MRTNIFMLVVSVLALGFMGCTRAAKDAAKLNLTIASSVDGQGTLAATQVLSHVSINVTGTGISVPQILTWDNCQDCSAPTIIPASFDMAVPMGAGRLIQILAVYKDSSTNQMSFYYGDVTKDLTSSEATTVAIDVAKVGSGNITGGRVAGRYFNTATGGPTGLIDIKYNPGSGKQPLIVDKASIVNGWFSMFMLSGASLQYSIRQTGEVLWGQELSLESPMFDPAQNSGAYFDQRVRALLPVHIEQRNDNGATTYSIQDAETYVWGYWGPGAAGKKVCTSGLDSSPVPQRLRQYKTGDPSGSNPLSVSHYINWNLSVPTKTQLTDTANPYSYVVFQGGVSMSSGCDSFADTFANQFTNFQKITLNMIDGNGGDSVAGFNGVFRLNSNNNAVTVSSADPKVISGDLLPGVEQVFNGLRVFKRLGNDDFRLENPDCNDLARQDFGPAGADTPIPTAGGNVSVTTNITAAQGTSGVSAVLCPVKDGIVGPSGVFLSKWNFNIGSNGVGASSPATKLAFVAPQKNPGTGALVNNVCTPMTIEARTASDAVGYLPGPTTITLSSGDGNTQFSNSPSCTGSITSLQTGSSYTTIYVKRSTTGAMAGKSIMASANGLTSATSIIDFYDVPGTLIPKVNINMPSTISAYECYPVSFESWHSNLYMVNFYDSYATSFTLTLPTTPGVGFYYSGDCGTGGYTTVTLGSSPQTSLYVKYTGSATTLNLQPTAITPSQVTTADIVGGNNITVIQPGAASTLDFNMPSSLSEGQCTPVMIRSTDSSGRTAPLASSVLVDLATTLSGAFYTMADCSTQLTQISMSSGSINSTVYFKAVAAGTGTFTASSTSPVMSVTRNTTVAPATFNQIAIIMPGQTFVNGAAYGMSVQGTPNKVPQGTPSYFDIYLVKYNGMIDTTANGYYLTSGNINNASMPTPGGILFTNGVATGISFLPDNSYTDIYVSLNAGSYYGNTLPVKTFAPATMLNVYMTAQSSLPPNGCQIFAVIPETTDGATSVVSPTSYTLTTDNGATIYTDANCTIAASTSQMMNTNNRISAFYFKQPNSNTSSAITVIPSNGLVSTSLNVATNTSATGSAYSYMFTGRMSSMKAVVCQPYLVSVVDNADHSVVIGADQSVSLTVSSGGGTVGTFDNQSCDYPYDGAPTSIPSATNYVSVFLTAMIQGSTNLLNASGSPLQPRTSTGIVPSP
ncbi:MAG: hypothetical protein JSU04_02605 [Bdellovibrionales bacterium]|nr:hypothetical protein [Bdellovibrionales bacterium]